MPLNIALLAVSDNTNNDKENAGIILAEKISELKHNILEKKFINDNENKIKEILKNWINNDQLNAIIITGGIGSTGQGIIPEILKKITDKNLPSFGELTKKLNYATCAFLAKKKYIFSLPGNKKAVIDICESVFKYHLDINYATFLNFNANKKVTPTSLFYGQLNQSRLEDMKNELNKQIKFYLSNSKKKINTNIDLNQDSEKFILVEIGSYLGESLEVWGDILERTLKNNFLIISIDPYIYYASDTDKNYLHSVSAGRYIIDKSTPKKSPKVVKMSEYMDKIYMYFINNISLKKWRDKHIHLRMISNDAFDILKKLNIKIDFCYIDGSHYYKAFKFDLDNYCKILKFNNGYKGKICGDDFETNYDELLKEFDKKKVDKILNENKTTDFLRLDNFHFHPGITLAMNEAKNKIKKFPSGFWTIDN